MSPELMMRVGTDMAYATSGFWTYGWNYLEQLTGCVTYQTSP